MYANAIYFSYIIIYNGIPPHISINKNLKHSHNNFMTSFSAKYFQTTSMHFIPPSFIATHDKTNHGYIFKNIFPLFLSCVPIVSSQTHVTYQLPFQNFKFINFATFFIIKQISKDLFIFSILRGSSIICYNA